MTRIAEFGTSAAMQAMIDSFAAIDATIYSHAALLVPAAAVVRGFNGFATALAANG